MAVPSRSQKPALAVHGGGPVRKHDVETGDRHRWGEPLRRSEVYHLATRQVEAQAEPEMGATPQCGRQDGWADYELYERAVSQRAQVRGRTGQPGSRGSPDNGRNTLTELAHTHERYLMEEIHLAAVCSFMRNPFRK